MRLDSAQFLLLAFTAVLFFRLAGRTGRSAVIALASFAFLASFARTPLFLVPIVVFVLLGYCALLLASRYPQSAVLTMLVAFFVTLFVWIKHYSIISNLPSLPFAYSTVGLSYLLFRVLHLIVDVSQAVMRRPGFASYFNYMFFLLSFSSGPIQRYGDFQDQMEQEPVPLAIDDINTAIDRILLGYFLLTIVDACFQWIFAKLSVRFIAGLAMGDLSPRAFTVFSGLAPVYMMHVYVNFAAYMHVIIGIGLMMGLRLPENFNHPLAARNFFDFWNRWHITLSEWFRDYMFNPLLKALLSGPAPANMAPYLASIVFFATFGVIGLWHGTSFAFVVLGLLFGSGASINKLWQTALANHMGRPRYKALQQQRWYIQAARSLTLSYIAVALTCVWITPQTLVWLLTPRGVLLGIGTTAVLTMLGIVSGYLWEARPHFRLPNIGVRTPILAGTWRAILIFTVLSLALAVNAASDIIYKDF